MKKQLLVLFFGFILTSSSIPLTHDYPIYDAYAQPSESDIRDIGNYSIYGLHNVLLGMNVTVNSGNVGAHASSSTMQLPSNAEVWIKDNSNFVDAESAVVGDTVIIRQGSIIQNIFSNELQNDGIVLGVQMTPLILPVVDNLPQLPNSVSGTTSVNVPTGGSLSLAPGQYGNISVDIGGTLTLTGGIYNVTSIDAKKDSNIFIDTSSEIVVDDSISWAKGVVVGPSATSSITAKDIIIFVKGNADINAITTSTDFGKDAVVNANIFAPNGEIKMDKGTKATGAFIAKTVTIEQDSIITLDSAFNRPQRLAEEYLALIAKLDNVGINLNQTIITQELIDGINSDLTRIKEIVIELQELGFDGELTSQRVGTQMIGTVSFFDENTMEILFETEIPDGALGIFATIGLNNEYFENGVVFTFDQLADLLHSSSVLVGVITNFDDDAIASRFIFSSIGTFHPSTGNTFIIPVLIGINIAINFCLNDTLCSEILSNLLQESVEKTFDFAFPIVTITGLKFNDKNGDGVQNNPLVEPGLSGWRFTMNPTLDFDPENPFVETFSNTNGEFAFVEQRVPRYADTIFIIETQQDNWQVTTPQGLIHEIPFIDPPVPVPGQPTPISEFPPQVFGNRLNVQFPLTILDVSPKLGGNACNINNALFSDGVVSGLDYMRFGFGTGGLGQLPGNSQFVAGCIAADFGSIQNLGDVTVTAGRDFNACGAGCSGSFCTRATEAFSVFHSPDLQTFTTVGNSPPLPQTEILDDYQFTITEPTRYVAICRGGSGPAASDIMVDSVATGSGFAALSSLAFTPTVGGPYFYLELNQTSINTTRPDTVTIPLKVEWDAGFSAIDVNIQVNNMTSGISATVDSVANSTNYKLFNITFDVTPEAQLGENIFEIIVEEIDSGFTIGDLFSFNVN